MSMHPTPPPDGRVPSSTDGTGARHRSRVRALGVGAVVAGLVGVGVTFAVAAEPSAQELPAVREAAGHHHATSVHPGLARSAVDYGHGPTDAEHSAVLHASAVHPATVHAVAGHTASGHGGHGAKGAHVGHVLRDLAAARRATARFHRLARAEAAGYARLPAGAPLHECIDEDIDLDDTDGTPAMGIHWVNGGLLDGTVSARSPEVLVYEPRADGSLKLVAVEYVVFESDWTGAEPPELFGMEFHHFAAPNRYDLPAFYALHAWIWDHNPAGVFENFNPTVSCTNAAAVP